MEKEYIKLQIPPWPEFTGASYRYFLQKEKHITRICDYYVLIFMLEQTLFFQEDSKMLELNKGEWYVQSPGLLQTSTIGSPAPSYFYIHFTAQGTDLGESNYTSLYPGDTNSNVVLAKRGVFDRKLLKPLFDQLDYCYRNRSLDKLGLQSIFLSILNNIIVSPPAELGAGLAIQVTQFISGNYNKELSCDLLADRFHFSTEYINRKVKQYCGLTPGQYLQETRINRAMELLSNTDHTLSYISSEVGYHDSTVFYKAFRKLIDMSPGEWRERSRGIKKNL